MGDPKANVALGLKRAMSVRSILVDAGLAASTVEVTSHGEADLLRQDFKQHSGAAQSPCRDHGEVTTRVQSAWRATPPPDLPVRRCSGARRRRSRDLSTRAVRPRRRRGVRHASCDPSAPRVPARTSSIVDVDERSLSSIGQWPWRRDVVGRLIARLRDAGATVIALDIIFAEPDRYGQIGDAEGQFAGAAASTPDAELAGSFATVG